MDPGPESWGSERIGADAGGVCRETQGRTSKKTNTRGKELEAAKFSEGARGAWRKGREGRGIRERSLEKKKPDQEDRVLV